MELQESLGEFEKRDAAVVAVSVDPVATSRGLGEKLGITFPILADTERRLVKAVGVWDEANDIAWPAVVIVGSTGRVEWIDLPGSYVIEQRPSAKTLLEIVDGLRETR